MSLNSLNNVDILSGGSVIEGRELKSFTVLLSISPPSSVSFLDIFKCSDVGCIYIYHCYIFLVIDISSLYNVVIVFLRQFFI